MDKSLYEYSIDSRNVAMQPVRQDPPCRLNRYSQTETVQCFNILLDNLRLKKEAGDIKLADGDTGEIQMVFVGDSRIRQLYYERAKVMKNIIIHSFIAYSLLISFLERFFLSKMSCLISSIGI